MKKKKAKPKKKEMRQSIEGQVFRFQYFSRKGTTPQNKDRYSGTISRSSGTTDGHKPKPKDHIKKHPSIQDHTRASFSNSELNTKSKRNYMYKQAQRRAAAD